MAPPNVAYFYDEQIGNFCYGGGEAMGPWHTAARVFERPSDWGSSHPRNRRMRDAPQRSSLPSHELHASAPHAVPRSPSRPAFAGNPMRPHRARLVYSLVNSYGLGKQMQVFRPEPRTYDQLTEFHADGEPRP